MRPARLRRGRRVLPCTAAQAECAACECCSFQGRAWSSCCSYLVSALADSVDDGRVASLGPQPAKGGLDDGVERVGLFVPHPLFPCSGCVRLVGKTMPGGWCQRGVRCWHRGDTRRGRTTCVEDQHPATDKAINMSGATAEVSRLRKRFGSRVAG